MISTLKRLLRLTVGAAITIRNDHRFQELAEEKKPLAGADPHRLCRLVLVSRFVMSSEYASPARTETSLMLLCLELEIPRLRSE
jgi:hypothetical protein